MNIITKIRIGMEIFEKHGGYDAQAEHDVLFAGQKSGEALTEEEVETLKKAGWHISAEGCSGCEEEGKPSHAKEGHDSRHDFKCNAWQIFP